MAWESGYTSDYKNLLLRLREVVEGKPLITFPVRSGDGDGILHGIQTLSDTTLETWTVTCINDLEPATFSVVGSISGAQADATVDVSYTNSEISFTITAGSVPFSVGDSFVFDIVSNGLVDDSQTWEVKRWAGTGAKVVNYLVSSVYDGTGTYNGEKAVDELGSTTEWRSQVGFAVNSWWQVEFDIPVDIRQLTLGGYNNTQGSLKDFDISYSDNGTSFTVDTAFTEETAWAVGEVRVFDLAGTSGAHKFWRITIQAINIGTYACIPVLNLFSVDNPGFNVALYGDGYDVILRGPGSALGDNIYVTIRMDAYAMYGPNWIVEGSVGYASGLDSLHQPGYSSESVLPVEPMAPRLTLLDAPMKYWLVVSGRVIKVTARFQSICEFAYLGFHLQYAMPEQSQYPYPLVISGSQCGGGKTQPAAYSKYHWTRVDTGHSLIFDPCTSPGGAFESANSVPSAARVYTPYNDWKQIANAYTVDGISKTFVNQQVSSVSTSPYESHRDLPTDYFSGTFVHFMGNMLNGKVPLTAITLIDPSGEATYGELDGVRHVPGIHEIESIITDDDNNPWLVINNVFRVDAVSFAAVRLL